MVIGTRGINVFFSCLCFSAGQKHARFEPDVRMVDKHWTEFSFWRGGRRGTPLHAAADPRTRGAHKLAQRWRPLLPQAVPRLSGRAAPPCCPFSLRAISHPLYPAAPAIVTSYRHFFLSGPVHCYHLRSVSTTLRKLPSILQIRREYCATLYGHFNWFTTMPSAVGLYHTRARCAGTKGWAHWGRQWCRGVSWFCRDCGIILGSSSFFCLSKIPFQFYKWTRISCTYLPVEPHRRGSIK